MTTTDHTIEAIEKRMAEAMPGPWKFYGGSPARNMVVTEQGQTVARACYEDQADPQSVRDMLFIASVPTDMRLLLDVAKAAAYVVGAEAVGWPGHNAMEHLRRALSELGDGGLSDRTEGDGST